MPKPVVLESPYAAGTPLDRRENELYALRALADSLARGEAPFASHLVYPQVLDDLYPSQREQGIAGQLAWLDLAREVVVYVDRGISEGMRASLFYCLRRGYQITLRSLDANVDAARVEAMLAERITIQDLFADVVLQLPVNGNAPSAVQGAQDAPQPPQAVLQPPEPSSAPPAAWGGNG